MVFGLNYASHSLELLCVDIFIDELTYLCARLIYPLIYRTMQSIEILRKINHFDLVITGNLDRFFKYKPGKYCVIENWTQIGEDIGNTSCFRFPVGKYDFIFKKFQKNPEVIWKKFHIEQIFLSAEIKNQIFWPSDWCKSFKHNLLPFWPLRIWKPAMLPKETSLVAFTGKPDPDDVIQGKWPVKKSQFYKKIYKQLTTPDWVVKNWS